MCAASYSNQFKPDAWACSVDWNRDVQNDLLNREYPQSDLIIFPGSTPLESVILISGLF